MHVRTMAVSYFIIGCLLAVTVSATSPPRIFVSTCEYEGNQYTEGDNIPSADPCAECFCGRDGEAVCMSAMCAGTSCGLGQEVIPGPPDLCCGGTCSDYCVIDGVRYEDNDDIPDPNPCADCKCSAQSGMICSRKICDWPHCPNNQRPVTVPGECCPSCPDESQDWHNTCQVGDITYNEGDGVPSDDPCEHCRCRGQSRVDCGRLQCGWPHCPNGDSPISAPGVCCPFCPRRVPGGSPGGPPGGRPGGLPGRPSPRDTENEERHDTCQVGDVTYKEGDDVPSDDPCERCRCWGQSGVECDRLRCGWPRCPNGDSPISAPGVCCPFCPRRVPGGSPGGPPGGRPGGIPPRPPLPDTDNEE